MALNNNEEGKKMNTVLYFAFLMIMVTAWFTHIIACLMASKYVLLLAGAFIFPVGIIHGVGLWFGVNW